MTDNEDDYTKYLYWSTYYDSYYDADSDCYLWYNTEVEPAIWQYWYEGISSDYGDYGWMEYKDEGGWWIEKSRNNWVEYTGDTSDLWHIRED